MDPGERELPAVGDARFVDPETDEELPIAVADMRTEYREAVRTAIREWRETLVPMGIDYNLLETHQPMARPLRALAVDPAVVGCDGVAGATVSATVTTEDGDPVANGTPVDWSVVALGTANPLRSTTTDGVTTTSVVPLAGATVGVTVVATVFQGPPTRFELADDDGVDNEEDGLVDEDGERDPESEVPNDDFVQA